MKRVGRIRAVEATHFVGQIGLTPLSYTSLWFPRLPIRLDLFVTGEDTKAVLLIKPVKTKKSHASVLLLRPISDRCCPAVLSDRYLVSVLCCTVPVYKPLCIWNKPVLSLLLSLLLVHIHFYSGGQHVGDD